MTQSTLVRITAILFKRHLKTLPNSNDFAWQLRRVFDRINTDRNFTPRNEVDLLENFPVPGPVGTVVIKNTQRIVWQKPVAWDLFGNYFVILKVMISP